MIKAILFDYNGLLVDDMDYQKKAYEKLYNDNGMKVTEEFKKKMLSSSPEKNITDVFGNDLSDEKIQSLLQEKAKNYFDHIRGKKIAVEHLQEILESLSKHFVLGIISNSRTEWIKPFFEEYLNFFSLMLTTEEIEKPKPDPSSLFKAASILNVKPEECVYLGDSVTDMKTATNAGMPGIAIPSGVYRKEELKEGGASYVFNNLLDASNFIIEHRKELPLL